MIEGFELSPQQKHLWQLQKDNSDRSYLAQCTVKISGAIQPHILKTAISKIISNHEILRTSFHTLPGMTLPLQVIDEDNSFNFREYDYRGI